MKVNNKDYKSLAELGIKGDALLVECDYRKQNSSFKDEMHFFKNAENIRLLCEGIESKKAEAGAIIHQLNEINKRHIFQKNVYELIISLRSLSKRKIILSNVGLASLLSPNLLLDFSDGMSFRSFENLLYGESGVTPDIFDNLSVLLTSIGKTSLPYLVKLPIIVAYLVEFKIDYSTIAMFIAAYLNRGYPFLCNKTIVEYLVGDNFKKTFRIFSLKSNMGDLMIIVREFLSYLNSSFHSLTLYLRRKVVQLNSIGKLTNNTEFDKAYTSLLVFMEKEPTAHDLMDITTIPRRTIYRLITNVKISND